MHIQFSAVSFPRKFLTVKIGSFADFHIQPLESASPPGPRRDYRGFRRSSSRASPNPAQLPQKLKAAAAAQAAGQAGSKPANHAAAGAR